eukprot:6506004-Pyramimonas_sp.AAC.1
MNYTMITIGVTLCGVIYQYDMQFDECVKDSFLFTLKPICGSRAAEDGARSPRITRRPSIVQRRQHQHAPARQSKEAEICITR